MSVQVSDNDVLSHIDSGVDCNKCEKSAKSALASSSVASSCIDLISTYGVSLQVCYSLSSGSINLTVKLSTPVGDVNLGSATLNAQNPSATLGGSIAGFKAEAKLSYDVDSSTLKISGTLCAPFAGCTSGSTSHTF